MKHAIQNGTIVFGFTAETFVMRPANQPARNDP